MGARRFRFARGGDGVRPAPQPRRRKRVAVPAQIGRQPFQHAKPALAVPRVRTIAPALRRCASRAGESSPTVRCCSKSPGRIRPQSRRSRGARTTGSHCSASVDGSRAKWCSVKLAVRTSAALSQRAAHHGAARHEPAGADDVAAAAGQFDHRVEHRGVVSSSAGYISTNGARLAANPVITALCAPRPRLRTNSTGRPAWASRIGADCR